MLHCCWEGFKSGRNSHHCNGSNINSLLYRSLASCLQGDVFLAFCGLMLVIGATSGQWSRYGIITGMDTFPGSHQSGSSCVSSGAQTAGTSLTATFIFWQQLFPGLKGKNSCLLRMNVIPILQVDKNYY